MIYKWHDGKIEIIFQTTTERIFFERLSEITIGNNIDGFDLDIIGARDIKIKIKLSDEIEVKI